MIAWREHWFDFDDATSLSRVMLRVEAATT